MPAKVGQNSESGKKQFPKEMALVTTEKFSVTAALSASYKSPNLSRTYGPKNFFLTKLAAE